MDKNNDSDCHLKHLKPYTLIYNGNISKPLHCDKISLCFKSDCVRSFYKIYETLNYPEKIGFKGFTGEGN